MRQPRPAPPPPFAPGHPSPAKDAKPPASPSGSARPNAHSSGTEPPLPASPFPPIFVPVSLRWNLCAPKSSRPSPSCALPLKLSQPRAPSLSRIAPRQAVRKRCDRACYRRSSRNSSPASFSDSATAPRALPTPEAFYPAFGPPRALLDFQHQALQILGLRQIQHHRMIG